MNAKQLKEYNELAEKVQQAIRDEWKKLGRKLTIEEVMAISEKAQRAKQK